MAGAKAAPGGVLGALRAIDAFPKVPTDFMQRTTSGGVVTLVAYSFMLLLFITETRLYLAVNTTHELVVDSSRGETISIDVDISFPRMPCAWLSLDAMDVSGELHLDVEHDVYKQRLSRTGQPLSQAERHIVAPTVGAPNATAGLAGAAGAAAVDSAGTAAAACDTCYGAEDAEHPCCNTCDEVRSAYQRKGWVMLKLADISQCAHDGYLEAVKAQEGEGCRMYGRLDVNKVAGNFHFAAGRSYQQGSMHIHDMGPFEGKTLDFTHSITRVSFGPQYPGKTNPLDGAVSRLPPADAGRRGGGAKAAGADKDGKAAAAARSGMHQYFLKVVPTVYVDVRNRTLASNQYSVTEHFRESGASAGGAAAASGRTLPGVFFFYDLSPIKVHIVEGRASFLHYLTNLCAIVGGVFAVSGLLDGAVHHGEQIIRRKMALGKFS
ncbi:MAG: endoplasmic reticulum vesicle transporter-domain-containing protein [Monoraphidium minutum]|nr:MAG: endoplasmic reticulum vesicle transporter-domain-containing protein [Monoraphidium minutum]